MGTDMCSYVGFFVFVRCGIDNVFMMYSYPIACASECIFHVSLSLSLSLSLSFFLFLSVCVCVCVCVCMCACLSVLPCMKNIELDGVDDSKGDERGQRGKEQ
ncbi:uncharacterized protein IWZ02DRAFT_194363 [Phyllosticta citriasiana]|uniref:uncharacterized protein n=1 Tax=Phyllosticta citriasiana TaxID=595635 RepID=UPI0030FDA081